MLTRRRLFGVAIGAVAAMAGVKVAATPEPVWDLSGIRVTVTGTDHPVFPKGAIVPVRVTWGG